MKHLTALLGSLALLPAVARAESPRDFLTSVSRDPLLPRAAQFTPGTAPAVLPAADRVRLLGIRPAFLSAPPGLEEDEKPAVTPGTVVATDDVDVDWLSFAMGNDNPFFDFRRRGDPGGVGFTRVNAQLALFDVDSTSLSLGLQAVSPAGLEFDGLADSRGATVVSPTLSLFQSLGDGTAVQAFVGKNVPVMNRLAQNVGTRLHYGVAVQQSLFAPTGDPFGGLFVSVGALTRPAMIGEDYGALTLDVVPGLTWKFADAMWITGGLAVPMTSTTTRPEAALPWQVTCRLQF